MDDEGAERLEERVSELLHPRLVLLHLGHLVHPQVTLGDLVLRRARAMALDTTTPSSTNVLTPSASKSSGSGLRAATRCTAASFAAMI